MPAPKKPTKQPPRAEVTAEPQPSVPKRKPRSGLFRDYLGKVSTQILEERSVAFERSVWRFLEDQGIYDGTSIEELCKKGLIRIGTNDERWFEWEGKAIVHMPPTYIKYE